METLVDARKHRSLVQLVLGALLACALLTGFVVASSEIPAQASSTEEQQFLAVTNQARAQNGLPPLQDDQAAASIARSWSQQMANAGTLSHNPNLVNDINTYVTTQWTRIGENVGYGPDVASIQNAFLNSPPHKANILGQYNRVGIGTVRDGNGTLWVTLDFVQGPPLPSNDPFGSLDSVQRVPSGLQVTGWAVDPDAGQNPITVVVYVDGNGYSLGNATGPRGDVNAAFPSYGPNHGYSGVVPAGPGTHSVCAYGINVGIGNNNGLGCRTVTVTANPFGSLDAVQRVPGGLQLNGWAIDPDSASSIDTATYVDNSGYATGTANGSRPDIAAYFPGYGSNHAYSATVPAGPGQHYVCVYGLNVGPGSNNAVGCQSVNVSSDPFGSLDAVQRVPGGLQVAGWAIDPDSASPITAVVYVDGNGYSLGPASGARGDLAAFFPAYGGNHAFNGTVPASPGWHNVCGYGINVGPGGNGGLGCKNVYVDSNPFGSLDWVQASNGGITMAGWAMDPDTAAPIIVVTYVDGNGYSLGPASGPRGDLAAFFPAYGGNHAYIGTVPVGHGNHMVCTYGINVGAGSNNTLGCKSITT